MFTNIYSKLNTNLKTLWKPILSLLLILVLISIYWFYFNKPQISQAAWWNDSWQYRQAIEVTNNTSAQTNVYISLTLNTLTASTSMQTDCGDFRFVTESGEILAYYIVSGCRSASNVIHVQYTTFPAGKQILYFYYGNPSAPNGFSSSDFSTVASSYTIGTVQAAEIGPGPVGYWSFDEGYGATAHDSTTNGNNGTIIGAAWQDESMCLSGKCLYFDGSSSYVQVDSPDLPTGDFTWSAWIKPNEIGSFQLIMGGYNGAASNNNEIELTIDSTGIFKTWVFGAASMEFAKTAEVNNWQLVSLQREDYAWRLYVNGFLVEGGGDNSTALNFNNCPLLIGVDSDSYCTGDLNGYFHGFIDEVKIYPYARSADQIRQDYTAGLAGMKTTHGVAAAFGGASDKWMSQGLVGYWPMDESATTSGATDLSGNGNTGTFYGHASTTAGKFGRGGVFDGDWDYISVSLSSQTTFTFSAWIYVSTTTFNYGALISDGVSKEIYYRGEGAGGDANKLHFMWSGGDIYGNTAMSLNSWHHIVVSNNAGEVNMYVDGNFDASGNNTPAMAIVGIGGSEKGWFFKGKMDELRIYNRALCSDEVRKLYEWAPGPVAHWKFDEKQGTTTYDSAASTTFSGGNHGTLGGGTAAYRPTWTRGKYGSALSFDGVNDYVTTGFHNDMKAIKTITVSAWVNSAMAGGSWEELVTDFGTGNGDAKWWLGLDQTNDEVEFGIQPLNCSFDYTPAQTAVSAMTANAWHHVAGTYDGANIKLFVDGILKNTVTYASGMDACGGQVTIGQLYNTYYGYYFKGKLDDVRIYNYARSQKQILQDMAGGIGAVETRLIASLHLSFDEGKGGTAYDSSVYKNNGTLYPGTGGTNTATSAMWTLDGKFGKAIEFDGTDDAVGLPNGSIFSSVNDFAVSAWIKPIDPAGATWRTIVGMGTIGDDFLFGLYTGKMVMFSTDCTPTFALANTVLTSGTWYHVLFTRSGANYNFYLNGVNDGSGTWVSTAIVPDGAPRAIGRDTPTSGTEIYRGLIDEVKIYPYALTEDEIKADYNQGRAAVMGSTGKPNVTATSSNASSLEYCVPGSTDYCAAPVGEWKFDEKTGNTAYDTSGNGNDGTFYGSGTSTWWTRGKLGSAGKFNGSNDYVNVGDPVSGILDFGTGDFSLSTWFKLSVYPGEGNYGLIIGKEGSGNPGYNITIYYGNSVALNIQAAGGSNQYIVGPDLYSSDVGIWHQVVGVFDRDNQACIYFDGSLNNCDDYESGNTGSVNNSSNFSIGMFTGVTWPFPGAIDNVRIYNYARTPAQIAYEFNRGKPIAQWNFDECSGSTIHDSASSWNGGTANNGTLHLGTSGVTATGTCASSSNSFWYNGRTGKKNSSGSFDGTDDCVYLGTTNIPTTNQAKTIAIWAKTNSFDRRLYDDNVSELSTNADGYFQATVRGETRAVTNKIITDNSWHNLAASWDGNAVKNLYVDGELVLTGTEGSGGSLTTPKIGCNYTGGSRFWNGLIDEVKIWNYALTAEQVKIEYNNGAVRFGN